MRHQQVVVAAVIERGGRILVSQRGPGAGQAGRWEFPGGKREAGEDDQAALARELREELGVDLEVGPLVWTARAGPLALRFFRCPWAPGQRPRPLGSVQFRWVRREDLPALPFPPADPGLVSALAEGRLPRCGRVNSGRTREVVDGQGKAAASQQHPNHVGRLIGPRGAGIPGARGARERGDRDGIAGGRDRSLRITRGRARVGARPGAIRPG